MFDNSQLPAIQIQLKHHRFVLDHRAQDRLIQSELFSEAWTLATQDQKTECLKYINIINPAEIKNWISKIMVNTLDRCTMKTLRRLGSYHRIKNYSQISRSKLLDTLSQRGVTNGARNQEIVEKVTGNAVESGDSSKST